MQLTRRELNNIIEGYLAEENLNEGAFGTISGGVNITFCDLTALPDLFHSLFVALRDKKYSKVEALMMKEAEAGSPEEAKNIMEKLKNLTTPGFLEKITGSKMFNGLVGMLGPAMTILTLKGEAECEYIIATAENLLVNVICPVLGLDSKRIQQSIKTSKANSASVDVPVVKSVEPKAVSLFFSAGLAQRSIVDANNRRMIPSNFKNNDKLTSFHFDLFELMSPVEYNEFASNPSDDISETAIENFINALETMDNVSSDNIKDWEDAFLMATPGTFNDQKIKRIFRNMKPNFEDAFETPGDATKFIKKCFKELIDELSFEGFSLFSRI